MARCLSFLECYVAGCARPYDEDRRFRTAPARHYNQVRAEDRSWSGYLRASPEPPYRFSRFRVVGSNEIRGVRYKLCAILPRVDRRRTPRRQFLARGLPNHFACLGVQSNDERTFLLIALNYNQVLVNN